MDKKKFIYYWDNVIQAWFVCANGQNANHPFDCNRMKNLNKNSKDALDEQIIMINCINKTVGKNNPHYSIHPSHMPEPYWGNPSDCSVVLLDYNPAGGSDVSYQTSIECGDCQKFPNSLTKFVKNHNTKYSDLVKEFPLLRDDQWLHRNNLSWIKDYRGYQWWQEKKEWLNHIAKSYDTDDSKMPLGMEFFGWHSEGWSNNLSWINNNNKIPTILSNSVFEPLFDIVKHNKTIAVCIGAEFKTKTLAKLIGTQYRIDDKTNDIYNIYCNTNILVNNKWSYTNKDGIEITAKKGLKNYKRNYRVYKITKTNKYNKESICILNTWAKGGNKQPARHFWQEENIILETINKI